MPLIVIYAMHVMRLFMFDRRVVGVAGVYDIAQHFDHERTRGVEGVSPMARAMRGRTLFPHHSPSHVAMQLTNGRLISLCISIHMCHTVIISYIYIQR